MKEPLTHRERVMRAVSLREPDMVPLDMGSHPNSSIHNSGYEKLKSYLGITIDTPASIMNKIMQDVIIDQPILEALDIDVRGVFPGSPDNRRIDESQEGIWIDEWGVIWSRPESSYYYDLIKAPLAGEISLQDIVNFPWPDPDDPGITRGLEEQVNQWRKATDCAIVLNLPSMFIHQSQYVRGFEDWYADLASNSMMIEALFDAILEVKLGYARNIMDKVGRKIDIVTTGDDMGTQRGLQFSLEHYRRLFKIRQARFFDMVKSKSDAPILLHTCGSVYEIIGDLIEIGVQILNPVQTRAANMKPEQLKKEFGGRIAFWGGVDIQHVLPFGTIDEVKREVQYLFETLGEGGGWVLCPSHNLQPDIPAENIAALYRHAREFCRYN